MRAEWAHHSLCGGRFSRTLLCFLQQSKQKSSPNSHRLAPALFTTPSKKLSKKPLSSGDMGVLPPPPPRSTGFALPGRGADAMLLMRERDSATVGLRASLRTESTRRPLALALAGSADSRRLLVSMLSGLTRAAASSDCSATGAGRAESETNASL